MQLLQRLLLKGAQTSSFTFCDRMAKTCEVRGLCSQVRLKCDLSSPCSGGRALSRCAWMRAVVCLWRLAMPHVAVLCQSFDG